jgi:Family of unknown function (DUF6152)
MRKATRLTFSFNVIIVTMALLSPAATVSAHHNMSAVFDFNDRVTLNGTLTGIDWRNPHVELMVEAKRENGALEKWKGEGPNPGFFRNRDISKADFEKTIGSKIIIEVSRARDGSTWGLLRTVTMPDGKVIPLCPENC